jgi:hypothetical protein
MGADARRSDDRRLRADDEIEGAAVVGLTCFGARRWVDVHEEAIPEAAVKEGRVSGLPVDLAIGMPSALGANARACIEVNSAAAGVHLCDNRAGHANAHLPGRLEPKLRGCSVATCRHRLTTTAAGSDRCQDDHCRWCEPRQPCGCCVSHNRMHLLRQLSNPPAEVESLPPDQESSPPGVPG